jgi:hypothetical protein
MLWRAEDHTFLQDLHLGEGRQLCRPCARRLPTAGHFGAALSQAFILGHDTRVGLRLCLVLGVGHIDREMQPHLSLPRMSGCLPGRLIFCHYWREYKGDQGGAPPVGNSAAPPAKYRQSPRFRPDPLSSTRHRSYAGAVREARVPSQPSRSRALDANAGLAVSHRQAWSQGRRWHPRLAKDDHDTRRGALTELFAA